MARYGNVSRRGFAKLAAAAGLAAWSPRAGALTPKITYIDTVSAADQQHTFTTFIIPEAKKALGIDIDYVVSSGPEVIQRLKAQQQGRGDLHVISFKRDDYVDAVRSKARLEKLFPERLAEIPNLAKAPKDLLLSSSGFDVAGHGGLILRAGYNTIYNSDRIKSPPKSWKELFERRAEFKGGIATIRPDAKSSGGRSFFYAFLNAMGADFTKPWAEIEASASWKDALAKLEELSLFMTKPMAVEPPMLFEQFKREEAVITSYSTGFVMWTRDRGLLPKSLRATSFQDGDPPRTDGYICVPSTIPDEIKPHAFKLVNFVMSDPVSLKILTENWFIPGTDVYDQAPKSVWETIPHPSTMRQIEITSKEAVDYIKRNGMRHIKT